MLNFRKLIIIIGFAFIDLTAMGQALNGTSPGIVPFQTDIRDDYETVSLSDLGVIIQVPVLSLGTPIPFNFELIAQPTISPAAYLDIVNAHGAAYTWSITQANLSGIANLGITPSLHYDYYATMTCPDGSPTSVTGAYSIVDDTGASHPLSGKVMIDTKQCLYQPVTATTIDGSGITVTLAYKASQPYISLTTYDRSGRTVVAGRPATYGPHGSDPGPFTTSISSYIDDPNGNFNSVKITTPQVGRETTKYDTKILEIGGVPPLYSGLDGEPNGAADNHEISYTGSDGKLKNFLVHSGRSGPPQTFATNFNCPSSANYVSPNSVPSMDSLTFPDGTMLGFTYEPTPGMSSGFITGRFAGLTLPTGGTITYSYSGGSNGINCIDGTTNTMVRTTPDGRWTYVHSPPQGMLYKPVSISAKGSIVTISMRAPHTQELQVGQKITFAGLTNATFLNGVPLTVSNITSIPKPYYSVPNADTVTFTATCTCSDYPQTPEGSSFGYTADPTTSTSVTDPSGNVSVYRFFRNFELQRQLYQGSQDTTHLLETIISCYNGNFTNCTDTPVTLPVTQLDKFVTIAGGKTALHEEFYNEYGLIVKTADYDAVTVGHPTTPPIRQTTLSYGSYSNDTCAPIGGYINDRVCVMQIRDGAGQLAAQTNSTYDAHGNLIKTTRLDSPNPPIQISFTYETNGTVKSITDPAGTMVVYTNAACGNTRPTQIQAGGLTTAQSWDCNGLVKTSSTDPNGNVTTIEHNDSLWRTTKIGLPDGGSQSSFYNLSASPPNITTVQTVDVSGTQRTIVNTLDGLGRSRQTQDSSTNTRIDTTYDALGRVASVSNPYQSMSDATFGATQYLYDALGRVTIQTQQDKSILQWCYNGIVTTGQTNCASNLSGQSSDSWVDYSDENNIHSQRGYDALGRITGVMEPDPSTNIPSLETDYQYDALSNLTRVDQWGGARGSSGVRVRTFAYDPLSRLVTSTNPETGNTSYSYVNHGVLCAGDVTLPCSKTDARGVTMSYAYDVFNHLLSKTYSGRDTASSAIATATPSSCWQYSTATNGKGLLGTQWTQKGSCPTVPGAGNLSQTIVFAYDPVGRITSAVQCILTKCSVPAAGKPTYQYNLAGDLTFQSNGIGTISLSRQYDAASRLQTLTSSLNDTLHPPLLFSGPSYNPAGSLVAASYGLNLTINRTYDPRLRITGETDLRGAIQNSGGTTGTAVITIIGAEQVK